MFARLLGPAVILSSFCLSSPAYAGDGEVGPIAGAEAAEAAGEWQEASWLWAEAWDDRLGDRSLQLKAGAAAMEGGDCVRAQRILEAYLAAKPDDKTGVKRAETIVETIGRTQCATLNQEVATEQAKELYVYAEAQAKAEQWTRAIYAYEDAYFLVPEKVGFAYKVGKSAFEARRCDTAEEYLSHFMRYGDAEKHGDMQRDAERMLNQLETLGCRGGEAPPPIEKKGCSLAANDPGALAAWLLLPIFAHRRRRA